MALSAAQWILTFIILFTVMALVIWLFMHIGRKATPSSSAADSQSERVMKKYEEKEEEPNIRTMKAEPSTVQDSNNFEENLANLISMGKNLSDDDEDIHVPKSDIADDFDLGSFLKSNEIVRNEAMMVIEKTSQPATNVYNTTFNVSDATVTLSNTENDTPNILPITSIKAPTMSLDISSSHSPLMSYKDNEIKSLIPNSLPKAHASDSNIPNFSFINHKSAKNAEEDNETTGIGIKNK